MQRVNIKLYITYICKIESEVCNIIAQNVLGLGTKI